jgi:hypothetical protein
VPALRVIIYGLAAHASNPQSHISEKIPRGPGLYSRKDLKIRGIYLPYIGFFVVLGLFVGVLKPYHRPAAFITGMAGNPQGTERSSLYDN